MRMNSTPSGPEDGEKPPARQDHAPSADDHIRRIRRGVMDGTYDSAAVIEEVATRIAESGDL